METDLLLNDEMMVDDEAFDHEIEMFLGNEDQVIVEDAEFQEAADGDVELNGENDILLDEYNEENATTDSDNKISHVTEIIEKEESADSKTSLFDINQTAIDNSSISSAQNQSESQQTGLFTKLDPSETKVIVIHETNESHVALEMNPIPLVIADQNDKQTAHIELEQKEVKNDSGLNKSKQNDVKNGVVQNIGDHPNHTKVVENEKKQKTQSSFLDIRLNETVVSEDAEDRFDDVEPAPPILIHFKESSFVLFAPIPSIVGEPLFVNAHHLFYEPLEALATALKGEIISRDSIVDQEIVLSFGLLDLEISEDNFYMRQVGLHDIYDVFSALVQNGSISDNVLHINMWLQPRFIVRFNELATKIKEASEGTKEFEQDVNDDDLQQYEPEYEEGNENERQVVLGKGSAEHQEAEYEETEEVEEEEVEEEKDVRLLSSIEREGSSRPEESKYEEIDKNDPSPSLSTEKEPEYEELEEGEYEKDSGVLRSTEEKEFRYPEVEDELANEELEKSKEMNDNSQHDGKHEEGLAEDTLHQEEDFVDTIHDHDHVQDDQNDQNDQNEELEILTVTVEKQLNNGTSDTVSNAIDSTEISDSIEPNENEVMKETLDNKNVGNDDNDDNDDVIDIITQTSYEEDVITKDQELIEGNEGEEGDVGNAEEQDYQEPGEEDENEIQGEQSIEEKIEYKEEKQDESFNEDIEEDEFAEYANTPPMSGIHANDEVEDVENDEESKLGPVLFTNGVKRLNGGLLSIDSKRTKVE